MKRLTTAVLMAIVLSLGIFASVAQAGDGNGNGGKPKGGTNICQPGFHDEGGTCVHNGDAAGNCGQNQSGDTGDGNDSNRGNDGDKGYGNRDGCDTIAPPPPATPPPATPPPATPPPSTVPDTPTPQAGSTPASTPPDPQTNQTPATPRQALAQRVAFKPPAFKHKPKAVKRKPNKANAITHKAKAIKQEAKQTPKRPAASNGATALLMTSNAPRKAPFTK